MVVLSAHSIESAWVEREVRKALKKEDDRGQSVLFPIRLDDAVMDTTQQWAYDLRRQRNIGDFRKWKGAGRLRDRVQTPAARLASGHLPEAADRRNILNRWRPHPATATDGACTRRRGGTTLRPPGHGLN